MASTFRWYVLVSLLVTLSRFCKTAERCINGEMEGDSCVCYPGWTGSSCDFCNGRIRLENSSGVIVDGVGDGNYMRNSRCLFFIEADRPESSINLKLRSFHTECQWDYLYVFDGDSVYSPKIAAYTGNIISVESMDDPNPVDPTPISIANTTSNITYDNNSTEDNPDDEEDVPFVETPEITLRSTGSQILLYFYSDVAKQGPGFEISYWVDNACPDDCSGRGKCQDNGTCLCDPGWRGDLCHLPSCPGNCSSNGVCNLDTMKCSCSDGYTGDDCFIELTSTHWERVKYTQLPPNSSLSILARASHSAVMWRDYMLVYGGYQFPFQSHYARDDEGGSGESGSGQGVEFEGSSEEGEETERDRVEVLRYHLASQSWDVLTTFPSFENVTSEDGNSTTTREKQPQLRYGHTSIVYNNTMYVFGGAKIPSEEINSELWALDLDSLTWTPLFGGDNTSLPSNTSTDNSTLADDSEGDSEILVSMATTNQEAVGSIIPHPVRSHTAHVVGSKMVVLFGLSSSEDALISYVQEYDFRTQNWSAPIQYGANVTGRMGHSSVYSEEDQVIYVYGGYAAVTTSRGEISRQLLAYNPVTHRWSILGASPSPRYLHSSVLVGPLLVTFGGCEGDVKDNVMPPQECFSSDIQIYNTLCDDRDSWEVVEYPGLPSNSSRYGHSSILEPDNVTMLIYGGFLGTFHSDMLRLNVNCSLYNSQEECVNGSALCAWSVGRGQCVIVGELEPSSDLIYRCDVDSCVRHRVCSECSAATTDCIWDINIRLCKPPGVNETFDPWCSTFPQYPTSPCGYYHACEACLAHDDCRWDNDGRACLAPIEFEAYNISGSGLTCPSYTSCYSITSCETCVNSNDCLWCPSLGHCVPANAYSGLYPFTYIYGQCLGWSNSASGISTATSCPSECSQYQTCDACHGDAVCGWCNDPSNTGLGRCEQGGFDGPREAGTCQVMNSDGDTEEWYFELCPACQCNGHSTCVNDTSTCEFCQDNTTGLNCESCMAGFYGNALNGGNCTECDCNGYNTVCNPDDGSCTCLSFGVTGRQCQLCDRFQNYRGEADNFCHISLTPGFVYTFSVDQDREREGFFTVTPEEDISLHFKFEAETISAAPVFIQLFLGRLSEDLLVLVNLTAPIELNANGSSHDTHYDDFSSNKNLSQAQLHSFARPSVQMTVNFTDIMEDAVENDYTSNMWDGDVTLVVYVYNLSNPSSFKITVDQQNYLFLLYFFVTFITCFSVLLGAFLAGWYIKRKLEIRALMRQQYIELRRRVARPFARLKMVIDKKPDLNNPDSPPFQQQPSYVALETCRDSKAAVLSLFVQLPGKGDTGRPAVGRSGLCLGSALVRVNSSKKPKDKSKKRTHNRRRPRENGGGGGSSSNGRVVAVNMSDSESRGRERVTSNTSDAVTA